MGWGEPLGLLVSSTCSLMTSMPSIMLFSACTTAMLLDHTATLLSFRGNLSAKFLFWLGRQRCTLLEQKCAPGPAENPSGAVVRHTL